MTGAQLAAAAKALIGCQFRLHGRDPRSGLDCIGVLAVALERAGCSAPIPNGYALRNRDAARFAALAAPCGFAPAEGAFAAGDVAVWHAGPGQFHLGVALGPDAFVHAHAGLRRVVSGAADPGWRLAGHWRPDPAIRQD